MSEQQKYIVVIHTTNDREPVELKKSGEAVQTLSNTLSHPSSDRICIFQCEDTRKYHMIPKNLICHVEITPEEIESNIKPTEVDKDDTGSGASGTDEES